MYATGKDLETKAEATDKGVRLHYHAVFLHLVTFSNADTKEAKMTVSHFISLHGSVMNW